MHQFLDWVESALSLCVCVCFGEVGGQGSSLDCFWLGNMHQFFDPVVRP
jgi:hypothetical protein